MELDKLSLELGIDCSENLIVGSQEFPFESDSDYSSNGNEVNACELLFPEASLYDAADVDETNSPVDVEIDSSLDYFIYSKPSDDNSPKQMKSALLPSITTAKPTVPKNPAIAYYKAPVAMKVGPNDSVNHHDYALPISAKAECDDKTESKLKPCFDLKKLLSHARGENTDPTPCDKILKSSNFIERQISLSRFSDAENTNMTKNAIAARENRLKKKQYIHTLENSVKELNSENENLKKQVVEMTSNINGMSSELEYLRSVLLNVNEISSLVKGIKTLPVFRGEGFKRRNSVEHNKTVLSKKCKIDESCSLSSKVLSDTPVADSTDRPGICVHVQGTSLSLELCHHCSKKASTKK